MKVRTLSVICLLACLIAIPVLAQQRSGADPLTGTWSGDWGPSPGDRNPVVVDLKLEGTAITGLVKTTNRPEVPLSKGTFDATARTVKMEAEAKNTRSGANIKYVIEGKLEGNTLTGSWNHDSTKGDFKLTKK